MLVLGRHAILDLYECDRALIDDLEHVRALFLETATKLKCTVVKECFHRYSPQGVSGVLVIAESHLSVHTWPEHGYAAVDLFTCADPTGLEKMEAILGGAFGAKRTLFQILDRGLVDVKSRAPLPA